MVILKMNRIKVQIKIQRLIFKLLPQMSILLNIMLNIHILDGTTVENKDKTIN